MKGSIARQGRRRRRAVGQTLRLVAPLEVALELPGDRLAAGLGQLGGVLALLEVADVLRDVLVLLGQLGHPALPGPAVLDEVGQRDRGLEQVLDLLHQGQRGLGARRLRQVVRHGGPERHRRHVQPLAGVLEDPDDAGRALVGRRLQLQPVLQVQLGRGAADLDRPGVRGLGQQRAERDHQLDPEVVGAGQQLGAELAPPHVGLDAAQQDDVAVRARRPGDVHLRRGPGDPPHAVLGGAHHRAVDLEVVEFLGIDDRDDLGVPHLDQVVHHPRRRSGGVVPALEGSDQHRVVERGHILDLDHTEHPKAGPHSPDCTRRPVVLAGATMWERAGSCRSPAYP